MDELFYVNVFRDSLGKFHYSTEEFTLKHSNIFSFSDAVSDAWRLSIPGEWDYICTLSNDEETSSEMRQQLALLEHARLIVELSGKQIKNFFPQELLRESSELDF